jgi:hypothetical protein
LYVEEQISLYGKSVAALCRERGTPNRATFNNWLKLKPNLITRYAHASRQRADVWADEILEIADSGNLDYAIDSEGNIQVIGEAVQRSKLKVDARKWLMAKTAPQKYGDKVNYEITGANGGAITTQTVDYSKLDNKTLKALLKATNKPSDSTPSDNPI